MEWLLYFLSKLELIKLMELVGYFLKVETIDELYNAIIGMSEFPVVENVEAYAVKVNQEKGKNFSRLIDIVHPKEKSQKYLNDSNKNIEFIIQEHPHLDLYQLSIEIDDEVFFMNINDFVDDIASIDLNESLTLSVSCRQGEILSVFSVKGKFIAENVNFLIILVYLIPYVHAALQQMCIDRADTTLSITKREKEVLELVKIGKTNWEISYILHISERTIKFHLQNAMKKLGVSSRVYAVVIALKLGLIKL